MTHRDAGGGAVHRIRNGSSEPKVYANSDNLNVVKLHEIARIDVGVIAERCNVGS